MMAEDQPDMYSLDLEKAVKHYDMEACISYKQSILHEMLGDRQEYREGTCRHAADLIVADHMLTTGYHALDIGCGGGVYFHFLKNAGSIVGIDPSQLMLNLARETATSELWASPSPVTFRQADLLGFCPDTPFDLVYSIGVIGHWIAFDRPILAKLADLTKPGGLIVLLLDKCRVWDLRQIIKRTIRPRFQWSSRYFAGSIHLITERQARQVIQSMRDTVRLMSSRAYSHHSTRYIGLLIAKKA